jgi:hypothetical protein
MWWHLHSDKISLIFFFYLNKRIIKKNLFQVKQLFIFNLVLQNSFKRMSQKCEHAESIKENGIMTTKEVGCAIAKSTVGGESRGTRTGELWSYLVCRYKPAGNYGPKAY